jgi:hypothetical protein
MSCRSLLTVQGLLYDADSIFKCKKGIFAMLSLVQYFLSDGYVQHCNASSIIRWCPDFGNIASFYGATNFKHGAAGGEAQMLPLY